MEHALDVVGYRDCVNAVRQVNKSFLLVVSTNALKVNKPFLLQLSLLFHDDSYHRGDQYRAQPHQGSLDREPHGLGAR